MKKSVMMITIVLGFEMMSCAQNVPAKVKTAFEDKFPNAKSIKWEKENDSEWEAEFKLDNHSYSANFSNDGVWKETETEMKVSELPSTISDALNSEYEGCEIESVEAIETPDFKGFEIEISHNEEEIELIMSQDGKIIKKKVEENKEEEEEE